MASRLVMLMATVALTAMVLAFPARAGDASDVRAAISGQLEAFRSDDGASAYSYAAPNIQAMFPSPQIFMGMVRSGYDPVYRSSNTVFGALKAEGVGFRQEVYLTDQNGQSWIARRRTGR
ncbi:DUF4864 domain-containing protein [Aurantimonas sp. E1-2-R+4]|uniref:DUF4864 domain-containing protein n=1 Tax=Aurantimonas sp. E1-2-R+4 TaxID=3113714 RepID=UPI002F9202CE